MKDLTHYFGQSPKSDESSSSLKENEASSTPAQTKTVVKKATSSDVLKCKTPGRNVTIETESVKPISADSVTKRQPKKSSGTRKVVAKKKVSVGDDFEVKSVKTTGKRRGRPKTKKSLGDDIPVVEPDSIPENESAEVDIRSPMKESIVQGNLSNNVAEPDSIPENESVELGIQSPKKGSIDQGKSSKNEAPLKSPTLNGNVSEIKPKSAKNIMHFFSPTKTCSDVQPEPSEVLDNGTEEQNPSTVTHSKDETTCQSEQKEGSRKASSRKSIKKLEINSNDFKSNSSKRSIKMSSNDDSSDLKGKGGMVQSPRKENCEQKNDVKTGVCSAFQMLMSKKQNSQTSIDLNVESKSDKSHNSNVLNAQENDDFQESIPKEFMKRKKRNRIESDTDDDSQSVAGNQQKKVATEVEITASQDEPKKKSLMNFFKKITKEEAEVQSQKVQIKVEAIVHHSDGSPYKSKSKKETGSQKLKKKKQAKQKRNEDEIEWLGSEEITAEDTSKKSDLAPDVLVKSPKAEEKCQDETKTAEGNLNSSLYNKAKRTLKLNSSTGSSSRSKRQKKADGAPVKEDKCSAASEDQSSQAEDTVDNKSPDNGLAELFLPNTNSSAKKLKQVSLESTFLKKQGCDTSTSTEEACMYSKIPVMKSFPTVSLKKMSPRKLKKAANAKEALGESPLKEGKSSTRFGDGSSNMKVSVSCDDTHLRSPPQMPRGIFMESPRSPKQPPSDVTTPQNRSWKMRVCLTPKAEATEIPSPIVSPITVDGSDEDIDVQEIAVVKKKKKIKTKSFESETKEPVPPTKETEVEIVYEENEMSSSSTSTVKLAPLFMRPKKNDRISEQAKQEFLQSGVPEQLKKVIEVQKSMECIEVQMFPLISHVTQLDPVLPWVPCESILRLKAESPEDDLVPSEPLKMGDMTTCKSEGCGMTEMLPSCSTTFVRQKRRIAVEHVPAILSLVRTENPDFQVIRYFKQLREKYRKALDPEFSAVESTKKKRSRSSRRSRGSNQGVNSPKSVRTASTLMWTDKYRATSSDDIIGNKETVQDLKQWLEGLRRISEAGQAPVLKPKRPKKNGYEDDFIVFDENFDSNSSSAALSNSAMLLGPHGSGKTNCVYALAADLGYKVLEINASERRSGKIMLAKLSEATQSHQVANRSQEQSSALANMFKSKTLTKPKATKRKIEKKNEPDEESTKNKLSLILIKDIDIVFEEEDEGFVAAVSSLISTSKRPVIFTTTEADCASLKRIVNSSTLLLQFAPDTKALCSWLEIVALVEGTYVSRNALHDLLSLCNGDVRRCLLQLQVWMSTGGNNLLEAAGSKDASLERQEKALLQEFLECDVKEEDLSAEVTRCSLTAFEHFDCIGALQGRNDIELDKDRNSVTIPLPMSLGCVWWNLPQLLSLPQIEVSELVVPDVPEKRRHFKRIFDDSTFDMTSDDEDSPDVPDSQINKPGEETDSPTETEAEPANSEPEVKVFDVDRCSQEEMDAMLGHLQALSTCDLIATTAHLPEVCADFEPTPRSWQNVPRASLAQSAAMSDGPNLLVEEISRGVCHWLAQESIEHTRSIVQENPLPGRYDALLPDQKMQRRRLNVADAEEAAMGVVASCIRLDRSAIALDYLPTLRIISVSEQKRSKRKCSRGNRFYHYFKNFDLFLSREEEMFLNYVQ